MRFYDFENFRIEFSFPRSGFLVRQIRLEQDGCGVEIENRRVPAKTCPILQTHGDVDDIVDIGQMHKMKAAISGSWI